MCVIVVSEAGINPPTKSQLKDMWDKNPHGAGILIDDGSSEIEYTKGFMTFEELYKGFKDYSKQYDLKDNVVAVHFRIKTHGKTDSFTTHPFLLSPRYEDLRITHYHGKVPALMHNGTISNFGGMIDKNASDTQDYAATIGYSMLRKNKRGKKPNKSMVQAAANTISGSRMVVFYGDKKPVFIGNWLKDGDLLVSNKSYCPITSSYYSGSSSLCGYKPSYTTTTKKDTKSPTMNPSWISSMTNWYRFTTKSALESAIKYWKVEELKEYSILTDRYGGIKYLYKVKTLDGLGFEKTYYDVVDKDFLKEYTEIISAEKEDLGEGFDDIMYADDDFYFKIEYDLDSDQIKTPSGKNMYIDEICQMAFTDKGLKDNYGENWRLVRQDLIVNGTETIDWHNPSDKAIAQFKKSLSDFYTRGGLA